MQTFSINQIVAQFKRQQNVVSHNSPSSCHAFDAGNVAIATAGTKCWPVRRWTVQQTDDVDDEKSSTSLRTISGSVSVCSISSEFFPSVVDFDQRLNERYAKF